MEKEIKLSYGIKSKLISATAMLLVAVIMVVSSTYAWFTLSTKPEVKSISTAVGANGALEIVLLSTKDSNGKWVYNSGILGDNADENTYWGNLIDLSNNEKYGSNKIVLSPSLLNIVNGADGEMLNEDALVQIPKINAGGRPSDLFGAGQFGVYDSLKQNFFASDDNFGFRAIGVASGLTAREKAFNNAIASMGAAQAEALRYARSSLDTNGNTLASIAVKKGLDTNGTAKYTVAEVNAINAMIADLKNSIKNAETAYIYALVAFSLSNLNTFSDNDDAAIVTSGTISDFITNETYSQTLGARLEAALGYFDTLDNTGALRTLAESHLLGYTDSYARGLNALKTVSEISTAGKEEFTWDEIKDSLTCLMDAQKVTINGLSVSEVKTDNGKTEIFNAVASGKGITVRIPSKAAESGTGRESGGIYADIADLCENYTVEILLDLAEFNIGISGEDAKLPAKMVAGAEQDQPKYLSNMKDAIKSKRPVAGENTVKPLTEFYGYVIDLGFKTNAAQSDLLLQYQPADRIYSDNNNEATMGNGSTMTFTASDGSFTVEKMKSLMGKIRVVFFDTDSYLILAEARLDAENGTVGADGGITAYINIVDENDDLVTEQDKAVITSLNQNQAHNISALVYLDGQNMSNEDVAATAQDSKSLTGTMNLQFASSATLVPMEYADLHTPQNSNAESTN